MPRVGYDDRSFLVDERRIWLSSGSVDYFRVPPELWHDRLLKARRAGLNCISTCVPWNVHEPAEGHWVFEDGCDVRQFIAMAGDLGLYVILRPGPYIGADWDFGGLPAWLAVKTGITYRTANATYMHYFDKYLGQLLPRLADLQVGRGGNIVLIQNEHEYTFTTMPDRVNYCEFISQLYGRAGFDIPIVTCNHLTQPPIPDTVECVNGWARAVEQLKRLRTARPGAPMLMTELRCGWFDHWGGSHSPRGAREMARRAMEVLGCGSQFNYYMWHGGTNFGFGGGRLAVNDWSYVTTTYDGSAPLSEGGAMTEGYYLTRLPNLLASHFGGVFAAGRMEGPSVTVHDGTQVLSVSGAGGRMSVITANGREGVETARISLSDGRPMEVPLEPIGAVAIAENVRLSPERVLDYANVMPLGLFGEGNLVFHAPAGWPARISVNGREVREQVPANDEPKLLELKDQRIVLVNSALALRSWDVDGSLVMGPDFVGETLEDVEPTKGSRQYAILSPEGQLTHKKVRSGSSRKPTVPRLSGLTRVCICEEPLSDELAWEKLDGPRDVAAAGVARGYAWVRVQVETPKAGHRHLYLPECEDRALIYVNGAYVGVWGRGPDAVRKPIGAAMKKGANELVFLLDNLGRDCTSARLDQPKGLYGHVWDAKPLRLNKFKIKGDMEFSRRMIPRLQSHLLGKLESLPMSAAEVNFKLPKICPVHLSYTRLPSEVIVLCNGRQADLFPAEGGYGQLVLGNELKRGTNTLRLLLWGELDPQALNHVKLHLLTESLTGRGLWSSRRWEPPATEEGRVVGKDLPAWYRGRFKFTGAPVPLFVKVNGAKKGQLFLNGRNIGRFWNVGPQELYYLPECWLGEQNELLIFEEHGNIPSGTRLVHCPNGPFGS